MSLAWTPFSLTNDIFRFLYFQPGRLHLLLRAVVLSPVLRSEPRTQVSGYAHLLLFILRTSYFLYLIYFNITNEGFISSFVFQYIRILQLLPLVLQTMLTKKIQTYFSDTQLFSKGQNIYFSLFFSHDLPITYQKIKIILFYQVV